MSLPNVVTPTYTVQLKSIKEPVRFRPYTVKEEKIFLMAKESNEPKDMEDAVRQVLRNCTFDKIDIDKLPSFDIEYLFLQLRAKSVNNVIEIQYQCENVIDNASQEGEQKKCGATNTIQIAIDDIQVDTPDNHTNVVKISDDLTIEFKYPTVETIAELLSSGGISAALSSRVVASCVKTIIESNGTVHEARDHTIDELVEFIEALTLQQIQLCQAFFGTMPSLKYETMYTCSKCGYSELLRFEGLTDFFG